MREAFIRSLMVGGGGEGHSSIFWTGMRIQGQVSSTPKCNDSKLKNKSIFLRRENDLRTDDAKN